MPEHAPLYGAIRDRVTALCRPLDDATTATPVPACPGWTVHDVLAHLAGISTDMLENNLEGVGSEPWTAAQVVARRDRSVGELLDEWAAGATALDALLRALPPEFSALAVADAFNHEQDVRGALGVEGGRDPETELVAFAAYGSWVGPRVRERGLPALRLVAGAEARVEGDGEPAATVTAAPFELARTVAGRRTIEQMRAYAWDGDPEPYLPVLPPGEPPASPLPF